MIDRELLEFAAIANGINGKWDEGRGIVVLDENSAYCWDPLIDNNATFILAAKLGIIINPGIFPKYAYNDDIFTATVEAPRYLIPVLREDWSVIDENQMAVIRRLVVTMAAEIGRRKND